MPQKLRNILIIHGSHHLTDHAFSGDGLVAWGFINELANRGHRIHVVTDKLDVRGPVPSNLTLMEFPRRTHSSVLHYFSYMRQVRSLYDRLARQGGIDVVHQMNPVVRGLSLALLGRRVPIVLGTYVGDWVTAREDPRYKPLTARQRFKVGVKALLDAAQQHFASSLVLATPHALSRIPLTFDVAYRVRLLHHGVDVDRFSPVKRLSDPELQRKTVLYVGALHIQKGILVLIDSFAQLVKNEPAAQLLVIGVGEHEALMQERVRGLGLSGKVKFLGAASREEVAGWLRACTVLCAPSYNEPYGQNILEAMATAKPVIASSEGGHPYLLDLKGGMRIEPGDVGGLAAALSKILADPNLAQRMGTHNRTVVEGRNAWVRVTDELELIYERAIARDAVKYGTITSNV